MDKFAEDAPALARWQALTAVLGDPLSKQQADVLVLLASWLSDSEVDALVALVRQARAAAANGTS